MDWREERGKHIVNGPQLSWERAPSRIVQNCNVGSIAAMHQIQSLFQRGFIQLQLHTPPIQQWTFLISNRTSSAPVILLFFPSLMCRLTQGSFSKVRNMTIRSAAGVFQEFSYGIMLCHVALGFHKRQEVLTSVSDNATLFMENKERITCGIHPSPLLWQNPVLGKRRPRAKD